MNAQGRQNVVVLGANSAIAHAAARVWAARGAKLFLVGRNAGRLAENVADLTARGAGEVFSEALDLADTQQHSRLVAEVAGKLGQIDVVLVAYGDLGEHEKCASSASAALELLQVNTLSVISLLIEFKSTLLKQGSGTLAVITSVAGDRGRKSNYIYGASKGALDLVLSGMRQELVNCGVKVCTIKPGFVSTPMTAHLKQGPLFASAEVVGAGIVKAIDKGSDVVYLPWFWRYIMLIIRSIPEFIFKRLSI